ncbi:hypothetical protein TSUD_323740 [Trifolium subterraneum]|uniref:Uncharacterized protein n=1 Tax=Trifolium subterraneum TaxID=3900 RepID=A0A2Z6N6K1_TRISU|nr:hypothetical protein TSUD_323740 [Trifolium subterraneum]
MATTQPYFDGPSFDLGIEEAARELLLLTVKEKKEGEVESESNANKEKHGGGLQIVEPYDIGYLDLNRKPLDLNKFPDDGLNFGFENEEVNKEFHNMLKIVDFAY